MSDLLIHTQDGVRFLTLNRVSKKNALTSAFYAELANAFEAGLKDDAVRVWVIQGHETVFSAGNDNCRFHGPPAQDEQAPVFRFLRALSTSPKPRFGRSCRPAVGIGTTLLLHCDLVYAGENALFSMPFVNLGLCPEAASSLLVPQRLGHVRAAQMLMLGESIDAATALEWGLINAVLPPTEVNAHVERVALKLAAKPKASVLETKRLLNFRKRVKWRNASWTRRSCLAACCVSLKRNRHFAAFMTKKPNTYVTDSCT